MERRIRVPERLAEFAPLLGVGLRHLVAMGGIKANKTAEPLKQIRIKYTAEDSEILQQLTVQFEANAPRIIVAALEHAARCRLNAESKARSAGLVT